MVDQDARSSGMGGLDDDAEGEGGAGDDVTDFLSDRISLSNR